MEIYNFKCAKWDGTRYSGKNIYYGEKYLSNVPFWESGILLEACEECYEIFEIMKKEIVSEEYKKEMKNKVNKNIIIWERLKKFKKKCYYNFLCFIIIARHWFKNWKRL